MVASTMFHPFVSLKLLFLIMLSNQGQTTFAPNQLNGLSLWLDATQLPGSLDSVAVWSDQSSRGNNVTQQNPNLQPVLDVKGGKQFVFFNSTFLVRSSFAGLDDDSNVTLVCVVSADSVDTSIGAILGAGYKFVSNPLTLAGWKLELNNLGSPRYSEYAPDLGSESVTANGDVIELNMTKIIAFRKRGADVELFIDGHLARGPEAASPAVYFDSHPIDVFVGADYDGEVSRKFRGHVGEVLLWQEALEDGQLACIHRELKSKWALCAGGDCNTSGADTSCIETPQLPAQSTAENSSNSTANSTAAYMQEEEQGALDSCSRQWDCVQFSVERTGGGHVCADACEWRVCMTLALHRPECRKPLQQNDSLAHTCEPAGQCDATVRGFGNGSSVLVEGIGAVPYSQCLLATGNRTVNFLLKDGAGCNAASAVSLRPLPNASSSSVSCQPRPAAFPTCSEDAPGQECVWTVHTPGCATLQSEAANASNGSATAGQQDNVTALQRPNVSLPAPTCPVIAHHHKCGGQCHYLARCQRVRADRYNRRRVLREEEEEEERSAKEEEEEEEEEERRRGLRGQSFDTHSAAYEDHFQSWYRFPYDDPEEEDGSEWRCICPEGIAGNGTHCQTQAYVVRTVILFDDYEQSCQDEYFSTPHAPPNASNASNASAVGNCGDARLVGNAWLDPGATHRCEGSHSAEDTCECSCPHVGYSDLHEGRGCVCSCGGGCACDCHHRGDGHGTCDCEGPGHDICVCQEPDPDTGDVQCHCSCDMAIRRRDGGFHAAVVAPVMDERERARAAQEGQGPRRPKMVTTVHAEGEAERRAREKRQEEEGEGATQRRSSSGQGDTGYDENGELFTYGEGYPYYVHSECPCGIPPLPDQSSYWTPYWKEVKQVYANYLVSNANFMTYDSAMLADTAHHDLSRTCSHVGSLYQVSVTMNALFLTFEEAHAAAKRWTDYDGFVAAVDRISRESVEIVSAPPTVSPWVTGLDCDPLLNELPEVVIGPSGFQVDQAYFDWNCLTSGCWVVDVSYDHGPDDAINVLYVPRAAGDDSAEDGGAADGAYEAVLPTFQVKNFPCSTLDFDPDAPTHKATACCMRDFVDQYRPVQDFVSFVNGSELVTSKACSSSLFEHAPAAVDVLLEATGGDKKEEAPGASNGDFVLAQFSGMPHSTVQTLGSFSSFPQVRTLRLQLDERELRTLGGMMGGSTSVKHSVETFVGLAQFMPTGTASRVMESFTRQNRAVPVQFAHGRWQVHLKLEKTNFFTLATHGNMAQTFLQFVNVRVHQVLHHSDAAPPVQFATVTFTIPPNFSPSKQNQIVPPASIRVGKGSRRSTAEFAHACTDVLPELETYYQSFLDQPCAPAAVMCDVPRSVNDRFVTVHVPFGVGFFDLTDRAWLEARRQIYLELDVSVVDHDADVEVKTRLDAMMVLGDAGVNTWCGTVSQAFDLTEVANVDILVGSAGKEHELATVRKFIDVASSALDARKEATHINSATTESGLMTFVLKGDANFFEDDSARRLELEDLFSVHIMERGDFTYTFLKKMMEERRAFTIEKDARDHRMHLAPTDALGQYCAFSPTRPTIGDPFPTTCIIRRDVDRRQFPRRGEAERTAMEVGSPDEGAQFMQTVFAANDYAAALGRNYSTILKSRYGLNGRYMRAFWVNPGYEWAPPQYPRDGKFMLSQRVLIVALVRLDDGAGNSRRAIVSSDPPSNRRSDAPREYGSGVSSADTSFAVNADMLVAWSLNVDLGRITTWQLHMLLTDGEACMTSLSLRHSMAATLASHFSQVATRVAHVVVTSARIERGAVDCNANRRVEWYSGAEGSFETAVVFHDAVATVNLQQLNRMAGVVEVLPLKSSGNVQIDNEFDAAEEPAAGPGEVAGGESVTLLITGVCAGGFGCVLACLLSWIWVRTARRRSDDEMRAEEAMKDVEGGWCEDIDGEFVLDKSGHGEYYLDGGETRSNSRPAHKRCGGARSASRTSSHCSNDDVDPELLRQLKSQLKSEVLSDLNGGDDDSGVMRARDDRSSHSGASSGRGRGGDRRGGGGQGWRGGQKAYTRVVGRGAPDVGQAAELSDLGERPAGLCRQRSNSFSGHTAEFRDRRLTRHNPRFRRTGGTGRPDRDRDRDPRGNLNSAEQRHRSLSRTRRVADSDEDSRGSRPGSARGNRHRRDRSGTRPAPDVNLNRPVRSDARLPGDVTDIGFERNRSDPFEPDAGLVRSLLDADSDLDGEVEGVLMTPGQRTPLSTASAGAGPVGNLKRSSPGQPRSSGATPAEGAHNLNAASGIPSRTVSLPNSRPGSRPGSSDPAKSKLSFGLSSSLRKLKASWRSGGSDSKHSSASDVRAEALKAELRADSLNEESIGNGNGNHPPQLGDGEWRPCPTGNLNPGRPSPGASGSGNAEQTGEEEDGLGGLNLKRWTPAVVSDASDDEGWLPKRQRETSWLGELPSLRGPGAASGFQVRPAGGLSASAAVPLQTQGAQVAVTEEYFHDILQAGGNSKPGPTGTLPVTSSPSPSQSRPYPSPRIGASSSQGGQWPSQGQEVPRQASLAPRAAVVPAQAASGTESAGRNLNGEPGRDRGVASGPGPGLGSRPGSNSSSNSKFFLF